MVFARFNTLVDLCARAAGLAETQLRQGIKADARRVSRVLRQMLDEGLLHRQGGGKGATLTSTS